MIELNTISTRLVRNSMAGMLRYGITVPLLLVTVPIVLHKLGPEQYGVWALFGVVTAFADLSDLGISSGLVRFIGRYWAEQDIESINRSLSTVLAVYIFISSLFVLCVALAGRFVAENAFGLPGSLIEEAVFVITGAAITFFISLISGTFGSLMQGMQRLDIWNSVLVIYTVVDSIGGVSSLALGYGLHGLVVSRILVTLGTGLLAYWLARRLLPSLRCGPSYFDWARGREIISYSLNILASKISGIARDPLNKTILLWMTSVSGVGYFDLGGRLANQARGLFSAMLIPVVAAAAGVQTIGGKQATRQLFYRSTQYVALAVFPIFGGLIVFAQPIITLWIGSEYGLVVITFQGLLLTFFLTLMATPAYSIMEGTGLAKWNAFISIITAVLGVCLSIGLGLTFGYVGIVIGYCLSGTTSATGTFVVFRLKFEIPFRELVHVIPLRGLLVYSVALVFAAVSLSYLGTAGTLVWVPMGIGYLAVCALGLFLSGSVDGELRAVRQALIPVSKGL